MHIDILEGAKEDIEALRQTDPAALAAILVFIQEAEAETENVLIDKFTTRGDVEIGPNRINVKPWAQARRYENLWRLRILETPATGYRVVYGFNWRERRIGVLAIVKKGKFDYELTGDTVERIFRDWRTATGGEAT